MGGDPQIMDKLKTQVESGQYRLDPPAIADAIIRWFATRRGGGQGGPQNEWANPERGPGPSTNSTPGGPSTTDPIQVNPLLDGRSA